MADYKAESKELDETFSDSHYLLDERKGCLQIHFQCDFPIGYVRDAMVRSQQETPGKRSEMMLSEREMSGDKD